MNPEIEKRIRAVYPTGKLEKVNTSACLLDLVRELENPLADSLRIGGAVMSEFRLWHGNERAATTGITLQNAGSPFTERDRQSTLLFLRGLEKPWVQCRLNISTVFPAYRLFFNLHYPRTDEEIANGKGVIRIECQDAYEDAPWPAIATGIHKICHAAGFVELTKEDRNELVPFVTEIDRSSFDDDSDDNEVDYDALPREACNVAQCLFELY